MACSRMPDHAHAMSNVANLRSKAERQVRSSPAQPDRIRPERIKPVPIKPDRMKPDRIRPRNGVRPPPRRSLTVRAPRRASKGEKSLIARDGTALRLRQIRIDDVEALQRFFSRLTPEEVRMRFLHPLNELPEPFARQLCELDPAMAIAWVLASPDDAATTEIYGVARAHVDKVLDHAEFAIVVQGSFSHQGLGTLLMRRVIDSARKLGVIELWGDVFIENGAMLEFCDQLGFHRSTTTHNPGVMRVELSLVIRA